MTADAPLAVRCLCGEVELAVDAAPVAQFYCHCDDCRVVHGAAYIGVALFEADAVRVVRGQPVLWTHRRMPRGRCPRCGVPLFGDASGAGVIGIKGDRLPPGHFAPQFHLYCEHAWMPVHDGLPHYRTLPREFGGDGATVDW